MTDKKQDLQTQEFKWGEFLASKKSQIIAALPKHLDANKMLRVFLTEMQIKPKLKECTPLSILGCLLTASQLGLELGGVLGQSYAIPYKDICTFQMGYQGLLELAYRSGEILKVTAREVYENDFFDYQYGTNEYITHIPEKDDRGQLTHVYAVVHLRNGQKEFKVLSKPEIERFRMSSQAAKSSYSPWNDWYEAMAKKTVIKQVLKYLPKSSELQRTIQLDDAADSGDQLKFITPLEDEVISKPKQLTKKTNEVDSLLQDKIQSAQDAYSVNA